MGNERTADELRAYRLNKLGQNLGQVFHALSNDVAWLQVKWAEYRELFGTSSERIDILNSAAGLFFRILQDTLWEDTLLHLARLTDPAVVAGKSNLTIRALPELCDEPALRSRVTELVDAALEATKFARDWRNRHIGHRDLALALNSGAKPLASASRAQVSEAASAIHAVLNQISESVLHSTLADNVVTPGTGAVALMYVIRDGLEAEAARRQRLRSGRPEPGDLGPHAV